MLANEERGPARVLCDPRWRQVEARDRAADGLFYYSVRSTGVYCRPSCASRRARPENVAFHETARDAESAGFRPCKRCRPDQPVVDARAVQVAALCRLIEQSDEPPSLAELARHVGLSSYHTQRLFKAVTGVTPRSYAAAQRAERIRRELRQGGSVTRAIYGAGYGSSGRFYERSRELLGMTPRSYQRGGAACVIHFALGQCSLGAVLAASTDQGVCAILLGDQPEPLLCDLQRRFPAAELVGGEPAYEQLVARVVGLIEEPASAANLPLDLRGTLFQQRVWQALGKIPPGSTATYSEIASALGMPKAVRAVASACAANALAVAIPCHRVVRSDGSLSGYRWGVERKRELLAREARKRSG